MLEFLKWIFEDGGRIVGFIIIVIIVGGLEGCKNKARMIVKSETVGI